MKIEVRKTWADHLQSEVKHGINRMKRGKATGADQIAVEMIIALKDFGVEKLAHFETKFMMPGRFPRNDQNQFSLHYQKRRELRNVSYTAHLV